MQSKDSVPADQVVLEKGRRLTNRRLAAIVDKVGSVSALVEGEEQLEFDLGDLLTGGKFHHGS